VSWGENYAGSSGLASPKVFSPMQFVRDPGSSVPVCNNIVTFAAFLLCLCLHIVTPSSFVSVKYIVLYLHRVSTCLEILKMSQGI